MSRGCDGVKVTSPTVLIPLSAYSVLEMWLGSGLSLYRRPSGWNVWSGSRDLNPGPLRPERSALPSCATPREADYISYRARRSALCRSK